MKVYGSTELIFALNGLRTEFVAFLSSSKSYNFKIVN